MTIGDAQTHFQVGDWYIEPDTGRINNGQDENKLEPKVMTVLLCLVSRPGEVVSREELESTAWAGSIVGYDSLATTIIKLRKAFGDSSRNPRYIETVPKRGYRLIATVRPVDSTAVSTQISLSSDSGATEARDSFSPGPAISRASHSFVPLHMKVVVPAIAVVVLLVTVIAVVLINGNSSDIDAGSSTGIDKPAVAVLPFKNISNDTQQDYFSDGITADLITDLSKISGLSVIARNTVFSYKNTDVDVRRVGRELGVSYVIEGSVRKVLDKVRISARLIDTSNGYNIWADRFDGSLNDVFSLQDKVTSMVVTSLQIKLTENERQRIAVKYTDSIEAYDQFLQGWQRFWEFTRDGIGGARENYLKAIELDPKFARAYANVALTYAYEAFNGWSKEPVLSLQKANEYANKAIAIDDKLPQVHWAMGFTALVQKDYQHALLSAQQVLALEPNHADGYGLLATTLNYAAKPKQALEQMHKAMKLNPRHPFVYKVILGEIYFNLRDYDNAIQSFLQALERNPEAYEPRLWLAAAFAHVGRIDDAGWQLDNIRHMSPEISVEKIEAMVPLKDPGQLKHLIDGLYKAGLAS